MGREDFCPTCGQSIPNQLRAIETYDARTVGANMENASKLGMLAPETRHALHRAAGWTLLASEKARLGEANLTQLYLTYARDELGPNGREVMDQVGTGPDRDVTFGAEVEELIDRARYV